MKKLIVGLSISAAVVFANVGDLSVGGGIGRAHVQNAPIKNYNLGNIRIGKKSKGRKRAAHRRPRWFYAG